MVAKGVQTIDPVLAGSLITRIYKDERDERNKPELSEREKQVIRLIALGFTNRQIADELVLSIKTVESHKANIKTKLNLFNRSELVRYAIESKLI